MADGRAETLGDLPSFDPFVDALFGGTGSGGGGGSAQKACEDKKGHINGIGPKCTTYEEEGALDIALCYHDNTVDYINALRSITFPACQRIVQIVLTDNDTASLDEQYAIIQAANEAFSHKVDKLADKCECKQCLFDVTTATKPPATTDEEDVVDEPINPDTRPNTTREQINTNSAYTVIPRVFGRYVTTGNIIWIGNKTETDIEYSQTVSDGETQVVQDTVTTVDMLVALGIGPMRRIMRIWFDEVLVYNVSVNVDENGVVELTSTNNASSDMDLSALTVDDYDMHRLVAFKPTIEFYSGDQSQHVVASMANEEGFGRVPASRGIATLLFKDLDLKLFGGSFPDITVDVIANDPKDILPRIIHVAPGDLVTLDQRMALLISKNDTLITLSDYATMETKYTADFGMGMTLLPLTSGNILTQGADTNVLDPFRDTQIGPLSLTNALGAASVSFLGYNSDTYVFDIALVAGDDGAFDIVRYDYSGRVLDVLDTVAGDGDYEAFAGLITASEGVVYYYQFTLSTPTQTALRVNRFAMTDSVGVVDPAPVKVSYDIAQFWTGDSGLSVQAVLNNNDNTILVFIPGADKAVKLNLNGEVLWTADTPALPDSMRALIATSPYFYYVSQDSDIVRITLSDGTVTVGQNVSTELEYASAPTAAQFYDGNSGSVTYSDNNGDLVRIFPDKLVAAPTSVGAIFDSLVENTPLTRELFDTSDVQDVILNGYYIDSAISIPGVFEALGELYQVSVTDNGIKIIVLKAETLSDVIAIPDDDTLAETYKATRVISSDRFDTASAQFYNIDDFGLVEINQAVTLRPDTEDIGQTYQDVGFSLQLNDYAENVRRRLEKVLLNRVSAGRRVSVNLMPRQLGLAPNDRISVRGDVYRIDQMVDGAEYQSEVEGAFHDQESLETDVTLNAVPTYGGLSVAKPIGQQPYRPIVLFTNALTDSDAARCFNSQIVYTGIDTPNRTDVVPLQFTLRIDAPPTPPSTIDIESGVAISYPPILITAPSPAYFTQTHTEGVHIGSLISAPLATFPVAFKTDRHSELVIQFRHTDTAEKFISGIGILETPTKNLLIVGRELIQFEDYSVDMDGLTVTFTTLHRGRFGTESYIGDHTVGEDCYLYTPESFKAMPVDPLYTFSLSRARAIVREVAVAGAVVLPYMMRADAGSARPYGPAALKRYGDDFDPIANAYISWHYRRSFSVPLLENLGDLPNPWTRTLGNGETVIIAKLERLPVSMEEWNQGFILPYYFDQNYDSDLVYEVAEYQSENIAYIGYTGTSILAPEDGDPLILAIMQLRETPDGYPILGYPTFSVFPAGTYPLP